MSHTSTAPPGATTAVPTAPTAATASAAAAVVRRRFEGSPGRLRLAATVAVLACLLFALLGGSAFLSWGGALADARTDAAQLVRVQTIQNWLLKADASATNAYLSGGIESPAQRSDYTGAVAQASELLSAAAAANSADAQEVATAGEALTRYTGLIEQARANNRQRLLLGQAYLRQAGTVLRVEIVPALERVSAANSQRVADAYGAGNTGTGQLALAGLIVLAGLLVVQLWIARRSHRVLNAPLVAATVGVLVALVAGAFALQSTAKRATDVSRHSYAATVALAQARTKVFDAKSQESLGLIQRGNSSGPEAIYATDRTAATTGLAAAGAAGAADLTASLTGWTSVHAKVRAADDGGDWITARTIATGTAVGSSNAAFTQFDTDSGTELQRQAAAVDDGLSGSRGLLVVLGWVTLILGLLAAAASWFGVSQRLEEYR